MKQIQGTNIGLLDERYLKLNASNTSVLFTSTSHYTGFPDRTSTSLSWADGSYTLTLTATSDSIYIDGIVYSIDTLTKQLSVAQEAVSGLYWFWLTQSGGVVSLNADTTHPGFDVCLVATVYWNTTTNKGILSDERHWMGRDQWNHEYLHETVGARFASGLAGTFTDTTFEIGIGEFYDEDIEHNITPAQTTCKVLYHNGDADWVWDAASTTIYKVVGGGDNNLRYNNGNALATVDNNKYANYWVFISGDTVESVHSVIGTAQYTTIALARAATLPSLGSLPSAEEKIIYKVTYQNNGGTPDYIEATDYRSSSNLPNTSYVATDHGSLAGLSDDDHTQYILANGTRALTANWDAGSYVITALNYISDVATGTSPYACTSTTLNTNLNADLLDGQHGSYYSPTAHNHDHATLTNLNSTDYSHLTAIQLTDLTDSGDSTLHYHASDRNSTNFTGTNWTDLTDSGATTLHKHDHGGLDGLADNDHTQYLNAVSDTYSINLTQSTQSISADLIIQDTTSVDLAIDASGLKATVLPAGVDHGGLGGLSDDDHTQYILANATRDFSAQFNTAQNIRFADTVNAIFGTGEDGKIYSSGDDLYITNVTADKDIIFQGLDGAVTKEFLRIDASEGQLVGNDGSSATVDFRWESDTNTNCFFVDANATTKAGATGGVGINTSTIYGNLNIGGQGDSVANLDYDVFVSIGDYTTTTGTKLTALEIIGTEDTNPYWYAAIHFCNAHSVHYYSGIYAYPGITDRHDTYLVLEGYDSSGGPSYPTLQVSALSTVGINLGTYDALTEPNAALHVEYPTSSAPTYLARFDNSGSAIQLSLTNTGGLVVNEQGNDADSRFESDANANLLYMDAGADTGVGRIGILTAAPAATLDVAATVATAVQIGAGTAGIDYKITFNGETNDGYFTWMEDEDYFDSADKWKFPSIGVNVAPSATANYLINLATSGNIVVNGANPKRPLVLSAAGGHPSTTAGCATPVQVEYTTNKVNLILADFDPTTDEYMEWTVNMPDNYDGSTLTAVFQWLANSTSTNSVVWGLQGRSYGDAETIDQAWGTAQTVTDANGSTANQKRQSAATSAITLAGTPAGGETVQFRAYRDADNISDNLAADARLWMILVEWGENAYSA